MSKDDSSDQTRRSQSRVENDWFFDIFPEEEEILVDCE